MRRFLTGLLRRVYHGLLPARAKNTLRLWLLFDERDKPPALIERFDDGSVLVLAPHMDDEVIGCGGALRRHVLAGARVTVVFLTDGRRGDDPREERPALDPRAARKAEAELAERRKQESRRAAEILGTHELVFLDGPDGALDQSEELAGRLADVLLRTRPRVVYLPSLLDTHLDHWSTNVLFHDCLPRVEPALDAMTLRQYEVWTPLLVNAVVDIEPVLEDKLRSLQEFRSQMPHLDVERLAAGLSRYRSIYHAAGRGHAEAFYESSVPAYRLLLERFRERR